MTNVRKSPSGAREEVEPEALDEIDLGEVSGAIAVDFSASFLYVLTLVGNSTLVLTPPEGAHHCQLRVVMGGAGSYTLAPPAGTKVAGGPYTPSTGVGDEDALTLYWPGSGVWRMAATKDFVA